MVIVRLRALLEAVDSRPGEADPGNAAHGGAPGEGIALRRARRRRRASAVRSAASRAAPRSSRPRRPAWPAGSGNRLISATLCPGVLEQLIKLARVRSVGSVRMQRCSQDRSLQRYRSCPARRAPRPRPRATGRRPRQRAVRPSAAGCRGVGCGRFGLLAQARSTEQERKRQGGSEEYGSRRSCDGVHHSSKSAPALARVATAVRPETQRQPSRLATQKKKGPQKGPFSDRLLLPVGLADFIERTLRPYIKAASTRFFATM